MKLNCLLLVLPLFVSGCLHTVNYKLTESDRWTGPKINGVLRVQPIADQTVFDLGNWRPEASGSEVWRNNYRGGYNRTNLTAEVTAMVAKHLAYSGLFTKVVSGPEANADYVLSGALTDFQAHGRVNRTAKNLQTGSVLLDPTGGLLGMVATAGMKTEINTSVQLTDLKLADQAQQILWHDSIAISNHVTAYFKKSDAAFIFGYPDRSLKLAVNEMIQRLGKSAPTNPAAVSTIPPLRALN